jgi:hypothetical protein
MKTQICYFCKSTLGGDNLCQICKDKYGLILVYTEYNITNISYITDNIIDDNLKLYYSAIILDVNSVRYHIGARHSNYGTSVPVNETAIYRNHNYILTVPGYPFTPANVKEKLKTYLIFL